MTKEKVLITGGAGFIGSNFAHKIARETNFSIRVFDKMGYAANPQSLEGIDSRRIETIVGDLSDRRMVADSLDGVTSIVHFAAESHNDNSLSGPKAFVDSNVIGTFNLLEEVRARNLRFHHISTDEVFGDLSFDDPQRFTETTPYNPSSPYSSTKAASDLLVRAWVRSFGIRATISNCSNNYGPRQHVEKFIPRQITNMLDGLPPKVYGDGLNVRDWIHVDDHNDAVMRIIESGRIGETYLIGADGEKTNLEVITHLNAIFGFDESNIEFVKDRAGHDLRYAIDSSKVRNELGWNPKKQDFLEGLAETVEWYRDYREWWLPAKRATEAKYEGMGQ
jgi:dTDP-glucose 4,6-dehydratase